MAFAVENFGIQSIRAKIGDSNAASLSMFGNMVGLLFLSEPILCKVDFVTNFLVE